MSVQTKIEAALVNLQRELVLNYDKLGLRASGKWANELENFYNDTDTGYRFGILGASYSDIMENGRRPNKKQDKESLRKWVGWAGSTFIKDWLDDKNIAANSFAVAWKIARTGIEVPNRYNKGNLVSDVINNEEIEKISDIVKFDVIENITSEVKGVFSNGNN